MMTKRVLILILAVLFLVFTIGLPVTNHRCQMMNQKSLEECDACKMKMEEVITSCYSEEDEAYSLTISGSNTECCVEVFDYKKVEDDFTHNFNSFPNTINVIITTLNSEALDSGKDNSYSKQNSFDLPPPKFGRQLLHTIHQLKIALSDS